MTIIEIDKMTKLLKNKIDTKERLIELISEYDKKANETKCEKEAIIFSEIQFKLESLL